MIITLDDIPPGGLELKVELGPEAPALAAYKAARPVEGVFTIRRTGSQVLVRGVINGSLRQECSRCLKNYHQDVDEEFSFELRPLSLLGDGEELELTGDDLDVEFFRGDALDLDHLLTEQLSLSLPMKPLCSEDCPGICSNCGKEGKTGSCACDETAVDPRWQALEAMKDRYGK